MMQQYVAGFLVHEGHVALIQKSRPAWQAGKLNGIGGKVEDGELPVLAMYREFVEETGLSQNQVSWQERVVLSGRAGVWRVKFFIGRWLGGPGLPKLVNGDTREPVNWYQLSNVWSQNTIGNLRWLIPLCMDSGVMGPVELIDLES